MSEHEINTIRAVDIEGLDMSAFKVHLGDCVVLSQNRKIIMQKRPLSGGRWGGFLNIFGGHIESGESVSQGLVRELHEELGAIVNPADLIFIGTVSEEFTDHTELVHVHFWHDIHGTITGCYEGEAVYYESVTDALAHPQIMDYARWALIEAQKRKLIS